MEVHASISTVEGLFDVHDVPSGETGEPNRNADPPQIRQAIQQAFQQMVLVLPAGVLINALGRMGNIPCRGRERAQWSTCADIVAVMPLSQS